MSRIELPIPSPLWSKLTDHYYGSGIQDEREITIWRWLEEDYGAKRRKGGVRWPGVMPIDELSFERDEDAVMFRLRWS